MKAFFLLLFWPGAIISFAQNKAIDSLEQIINNYPLKLSYTLRDTVKVNALNDLSRKYFEQFSLVNAKKNADSALQISQEINFNYGKAKALLLLGIILFEKGNLTEALKECELALNLNVERGVIGEIHKTKGDIYFQQGNYPESLKEYLAALKQFEKFQNKRGIIVAHLVIGNIYNAQNNYNDALKEYMGALKKAEEIEDKRMVSYAHANIGIVYQSTGNYNEALKEQFVSLKIEEDINDKQGSADSHINLGEIYFEMGNYANALKENFIALKMHEELGDKEGIVISTINIGKTKLKMKNVSDGKNWLLKGLGQKKYVGIQKIKECYQYLTEADSASGNFKGAYENHKMFMLYRDSLTNEEHTKKTLQTQMQYEFDKKEAASKADQDKKDAVSKAELQKLKVQKYSFIGGSILLLVLAMVLYNRYRLKHKSNKIITKAYDDLKKAEGQLVHSEKMASLGQLTAGVAHEINNPINFVTSNVKPLQRNYEELMDFILRKKEVSQQDLEYNFTESRQLISGIEEGALRTKEIVKGLRNFSRLDEGELKKASLNEGLESTLLLIQNLLITRNIEVVKNYGSIPEVNCYPGQLNQVFMNVITNAIDAIGEKGTITVATSSENGKVKISVKDTGKGMSEEIKKKIFDPFFTTKDVGKGTGLGLSITYGIIEKHNGKIEVSSEVGKGSEFVITL